MSTDYMLIVLEVIYARRGGTCNTCQVHRDTNLRTYLPKSRVESIIKDLRLGKYVEDVSKNTAYRWRLTSAGVEAMDAAQLAARSIYP